VIPAGRVVGFLHADYYPHGRTVDGVDRDILSAFAEGFGRIYERTVLLERLNSQREHVRETLCNAEGIMDKLARGELELARREDERSMTSSATTLALAGERSSPDEPLTPREREQQRHRRTAGDLRRHREIARQADPAQDRRRQPV